MQHLGIDLGTGSVKVICLSEDGREKSFSESYPINSPRGGYAETDTDSWISAMDRCIRQLKLHDESATVGFSGQMHGIVPCAGGKAIHPAILWNDTRASEYLSLISGDSGVILDSLMNRPAAGMALFSILWLKDHLPEIYEQTEVFLQPKDYIRYYFTGQALSEPSDAGATMMFDFTTGDWHHGLIESLGLDPTKLPPIADSYSRAAAIRPDKADKAGLPRQAVLKLGAADAACSLLGNGIVSEGRLQLSIGTGAQIIEYRSNLPSFSSKLNCYPSSNGGYYVMSAHLNGGTFLEWLRKLFRFEWKELYERLESRPLENWFDELGGLIFHPYVNGERTPFMNTALSGGLNGLRSHHTKEHVVLSALLGTLFAIRLGLEELGETDLLATGGSFAHPWWNSLAAQTLGRKLEISGRLNASAWGAALIGAGRESALYKNCLRPPVSVILQPESPVRSQLEKMFESFKDSANLNRGFS